MTAWFVRYRNECQKRFVRGYRKLGLEGSVDSSHGNVLCGKPEIVLNRRSNFKGSTDVGASQSSLKYPLVYHRVLYPFYCN
jgi:hypothetical protein